MITITHGAIMLCWGDRVGGGAGRAEGEEEVEAGEEGEASLPLDCALFLPFFFLRALCFVFRF